MQPKTITWFNNSPEAKTPECVCSLCGKVIDEFVPIRIWKEQYNIEARFHKKCYFDNHGSIDFTVPKELKRGMK